MWRNWPYYPQTSLTEEDNNQRRLLQQTLQHSLVDLFNLVGQFSIVVVYQPLKHRLFVLQVALKNQRVSVSEVDEGWEGFNGISLSELWILDLHHVDTKYVTLIVDLLEAF